MIAYTSELPCGEQTPPTRCSPLKYQRLLRGWSQKDVAREIQLLCAHNGHSVGLTEQMVGRWERGEGKPSPLYRQHLCQLYGRNAAELGLIEWRDHTHQCTSTKGKTSPTLVRTRKRSGREVLLATPAKEKLYGSQTLCPNESL